MFTCLCHAWLLWFSGSGDKQSSSDGASGGASNGGRSGDVGAETPQGGSPAVIPEGGAEAAEIPQGGSAADAIPELGAEAGGCASAASGGRPAVLRDGKGARPHGHQTVPKGYPVTCPVTCPVMGMGSGTGSDTEWSEGFSSDDDAQPRARPTKDVRLLTRRARAMMAEEEDGR